MSILDKDLVDQRTFEEQFMEMLYELYEIMMDGKLIADEVDKYPFVERGIGGLMWRLSGVEWGTNKGYMAIYDINDALYKSVLHSIEDEEQLPMLNKEYARDTINKLIDLYWDKYIYRYFIFEVKRVDGADFEQMYSTLKEDILHKTIIKGYYPYVIQSDTLVNSIPTVPETMTIADTTTIQERINTGKYRFQQKIQ